MNRQIPPSVKIEGCFHLWRSCKHYYLRMDSMFHFHFASMRPNMNIRCNPDMIRCTEIVKLTQKIDFWPAVLPILLII